MRSIKEKADEKYPIITGELQTYNEKFVEGANYVLDAITDVINQPMNDYLVLGELKKMILQLKK